MTEADLNMLALGMDLTKLGLNLNSPNYLSQTFRFAKQSEHSCTGLSPQKLGLRCSNYIHLGRADYSFESLSIIANIRNESV